MRRRAENIAHASSPLSRTHLSQYRTVGRSVGRSIDRRVARFKVRDGERVLSRYLLLYKTMHPRQCMMHCLPRQWRGMFRPLISTV